MNHPKFYLGQTLITPKARQTLTPEEVIAALGSHVAGNWGDVDTHEYWENERAIQNNGTVFSAYRSQRAGQPFFVVTEGDCSVTMVFLPEER